MDMNATPHARPTRLTLKSADVKVFDSEYETKQVSLVVRFFPRSELKGMDKRLANNLVDRAVRAALYRLGAEIELNTPLNQRWVVHVRPHDSELGGRVYLELVRDDLRERTDAENFMHAFLENTNLAALLA